MLGAWAICFAGDRIASAPVRTCVWWRRRLDSRDGGWRGLRERACKSGDESLVAIGVFSGSQKASGERSNGPAHTRSAAAQTGEILADGGGVKPIPASLDTNSRQGDLADQASGNNEVHIDLKLKQTDAKILQAIEEALFRMEKGTYGVCRDCGEQIARPRLNAIPWTRVCITCKEKQSA